MNPTTTGGVAITTAAFGGMIIWACGALNLPAPPVEVAGTIAALIMYASHAAITAFKLYFPPKAPVPAAPAQQ